MVENSINNSRIAKNTIILYIRMIFLMLINLYASRIVLAALGVEDYGIYNVVGGVVAMLSFLSGAMATGTQRYLTFELGKNDFNRLKKVFTTSINIHLLISLIVVLLAETVGLWFFNNKMIIPESRMNAAYWVFQLSVISTIVLFISVPYNAAIIAHEKMGTFAYISILDALLKLLIAVLLLCVNTDCLITYAILMLCEQVLIRVIYGTYCKKHFPETKYELVFDRKLFKEMLTFSGWNIWGSAASVGMGQGVNILLNVFFGPIVNAALGIAAQVQGAVSQFAVGFQTAINPSIIKSYASRNINYMHNLVYRASRYSFFLLLCICLPVFLETDMLLSIWLKIVPEYATIFLKLVLCVSVLQSVSNPLMTSAQATGKVKNYQSIVGGLLVFTLPLSYIILKIGGSPQSVFLVEIVICIIAFIVRLFMVKAMIGLSLTQYITSVIMRCVFVTIAAAIVPICVQHLLKESIMSSVIVCLLSVISVILSSFVLGLPVNERKAIVQNLKRYIKLC